MSEPFESQSGTLSDERGPVPASARHAAKCWWLVALVALVHPGISFLLVVWQLVSKGAWGFAIGAVIYLGAKLLAALGLVLLATRMVRGNDLAYQILPALGFALAVWGLLDRGAMIPLGPIDYVLIAIAWVNVAVFAVALVAHYRRELRTYFKTDA